MKRHLVWVLMVASLCAGCAARPVSEAHELASDIVYGRTAAPNCRAGDLQYCEMEVDGLSRCSCVEHGALFRPR